MGDFNYCLLLLLSVFVGCFVSENVLVEEMFNVGNDASKITWAHAVNSREKLNQALKGSVDFLEADVSLGIVNGGWERVPIMAHPPIVDSDISLEEWMDIVINSNTSKGVKLDFKSTDILKPSLEIIQNWKDNISFPFWLNADILSGPVNSTTVPVDNVTFFRECSKHFPSATLSVGWTTARYSAASLNPEHMRYSWNDVWAMARSIRCAELPSTTTLTFPVRGAFVGTSIPQLVWLLGAFPNSSLTVWSSVFDPFNVDDLLNLRRSVPIDKVFYDLPSLQRELFIRRKDNVSFVPFQPEANYNELWAVLRDTEEPFGCDDATSVYGDTIVYGGRRTVAVLLDKPMSLPIKITAKLFPYELSDYQGLYSSREGVMAVVASRNKTFWTEGHWVSNTRATVLAVGVGDPEHMASCCSSSISVHLQLDEESPHTDHSVNSCYSHETCKLYTDYSDVNVTEFKEGYVYVGFVFQGHRAMVLSDVRVEGDVTLSGGVSGINEDTQLRVVMALAGWAFWTSFKTFSL